MKIVTVLGARPQFIKAATVSRAILARGTIDEVLVHTGQHYDLEMSKIFFDELELPTPAFNLGIGSGPHGAQTGRMLEAIEAVLLDERPDWVLVYGDTNSTLAGALAAAKLRIPLAHVEAGLRSFNRNMPEEINRILTDHASDLLFAPTAVAVQNLRAEGREDKKIHHVGDVMYDAVVYYGQKAERTSRIMDSMALKSGGYVLATVHRAENTDDPGRLAAILEGLSEVSRRIPVVMPLHPRTKKVLQQQDRTGFLGRGIRFTDPIGYLDMVQLERHALCIATDSGGVQKEAFFHRVPCVTLREETEWVELVAAKWNRLCPPAAADAVTKAVLAAADDRPAEAPQLYGDGHSAMCIVDCLTRPYA